MALQAALHKRHQERGAHLGVHRGGGRLLGLGPIAQHLAQAGFDAVEKLVHALLQTLVFKHQRVAHHHPGHARIFFPKLQHQGDDAGGFLHRVGVALHDLIDQGEDAAFDELDQAFKHLRLAGEVAVQRGFADIQLGRQGSGGDPFGPRLLEHGGQGLQNLHPPLARFGALAHRRCIGGRGGIGVGHGQPQ